jgi:hypothetical protein
VGVPQQERNHDEVTLTVRSEPAGATVRLEGEGRTRGRTPVEIELPRSNAPLRLFLVFHGRKQARVVVPDRDKFIDVELAQDPLISTATPVDAGPKGRPDTRGARPDVAEGAEANGPRPSGQQGPERRAKESRDQRQTPRRSRRKRRRPGRRKSRSTRKHQQPKDKTPAVPDLEAGDLADPFD